MRFVFAAKLFRSGRIEKVDMNDKLFYLYIFRGKVKYTGGCLLNGYYENFYMLIRMEIEWPVVYFTIFTNKVKDL